MRRALPALLPALLTTLLAGPLACGGVPDEDGTGKGITAMPLPGVDGRIDAALAAVYDQGVGRRAGGAAGSDRP